MNQKDGSWWVCGRNNAEQFVVGRTLTKVDSPQRLPFHFEPWAFAPGEGTTLLLSRDGKLWTWGRRLGANRSGVRHRIESFLVPVVRRFPSLHFVFKSDIDETPFLLWELPPEVRRSLGTN
jgi:alpha-tubulin suppressor-like RCC1 family protein